MKPIRNLILPLLASAFITSCSGNNASGSADSTAATDSAALQDSALTESAAQSAPATPHFMSDDLKAFGIYGQAKSRRIETKGCDFDYIEPLDMISFSPDGKRTTQLRHIFTPNSDGINYKYIIKEGSGEFIYTYTELNDKLHPVKAAYEKTDDIGTASGIITYSDYTYDESGNWVTRKASSSIRYYFYDEEEESESPQKKNWTETQKIVYY